MKTLVIHAAKLRERGEHIDRMLRSMGMDYEFVSEADADALTDALVDRYLADGPEQMRQKNARASCTIKHFLACQRIVDGGWEGALVLEDDIVLHTGFKAAFERSLDEWRRRYGGQPVVISYEDSSLQFVPRSRRQAGQMLYPGNKDRMAGAYFVSLAAARAISDSLREAPSRVPVDCYHYELLRRGVILYLWCQPALATQGSFTGAFRSSLSKKKDRMIVIRWWFKKNYKRLLYWLR